MKKTSLILIFVCIIGNSTTLFSQQRGNKQNSAQQEHGGEMIQPQINMENMAGILMYDSDEVTKKLNVKNTQQQTLIVKAISKHNNKINEIKTFNFETFTKVKTFLDKKKNEAMANRDNIAMKEARI